VGFGLAAVIGVLASGSAHGDAASFFNDHLGLQLYSLRDIMKTDVPRVLDQTRAYGIGEVECGVADARELSDEDFLFALHERRLKLIGVHIPYDMLRKGAPAGPMLTRKTPPTDFVAIGTGSIDWQDLLPLAVRAMNVLTGVRISEVD